MAASKGQAPDAATPWYLPVARAIPAIAVALTITFTADHSAQLGFVTFGLFALVTALVLAAVTLRSSGRGIDRSLTIAQALILAAAGVVALALLNGGLPFLVFLVTTVAAITGFLELYLGLRGRGRDRAARDHVFVGALTALLALALLLVPPGFVQSFTDADGGVHELTASVIVVGALGAYWAILGVYLAIAGLSIKWATEPAAASGEA